MLIIGEKINSSRKPIAEAVAKKDSAYLIEQAKLQAESGADFIDVNCAISLANEKDDIVWLINLLQSNLGDIPICIDSPACEVTQAALDIHKGKPFINSITAEHKRFDSMKGIIKGKNINIIALTINDAGMPATAQERFNIAKKLVEALENNGIKRPDIYVDTLVKPISSEPTQAKEFIKTITSLKANDIKTIGGLSNVSYGLPARRILNAVFLHLCINAGIEAAIIDPADVMTQKVINNKIHDAIQPEIFELSEKALLGEDAYCMNYIKAYREGRLNG